MRRDCAGARRRGRLCASRRWSARGLSGCYRLERADLLPNESAVSCDVWGRLLAVTANMPRASSCVVRPEPDGRPPRAGQQRPEPCSAARERAIGSHRSLLRATPRARSMRGSCGPGHGRRCPLHQMGRLSGLDDPAAPPSVPPSRSMARGSSRTSPPSGRPPATRAERSSGRSRPRPIPSPSKRVGSPT